MANNKVTDRGLERLVLKFDSLSQPGPLMRKCHQRTREIYSERLGDTGLSRQQTALMIAIYQNPNATYTRLSEASGFDRSTMAEMIDRLVAGKLALRKKSPDDGRAYAVELTAKGRRLLESMIKDVNSVQQSILKPLPKELRPVFIRCLRIMLELEKG